MKRKPRRSMEYERKDRSNRFAIYRRENGKCLVCGDRGMDIHEIISRAELTDIDILFSEKNRVLLCRYCHTNKADRELLIRIMRNKYQYDYTAEPFRKYNTIGDKK